MGRKRLELTGQRFSRLLAIKEAGRSKWGYILYLCKCDCGNEKIIIGGNLISDVTKSCGCLMREQKNNFKHGETGTKLHNIWTSMHQRCNNPNNQDYLDYGGKGITICDEWLEFLPFRDWSWFNGYKEGLSIDRIENDGNYEPSNCQWLTRSEHSIKTNIGRMGIKYKKEIREEEVKWIRTT